MESLDNRLLGTLRGGGNYGKLYLQSTEGPEGWFVCGTKILILWRTKGGGFSLTL